MTQTLNPTVLVVFGATGDLMARKVVPALYNLRARGLVPDRLRVVGFSRRDWDDETLRGHVRGILGDCCAAEPAADIESFLGLFCYHQGQFDDPGAYERLAERLSGIEREWGVCPNVLFFLAVPPDMVPTILERLAAGGLTQRCSDAEGWTRVLLEKPFGSDGATSRELQSLVSGLLAEEQVYRIDHYLAKELLQGIMDFRFANNLFESEWSREAIERIDITLIESVGVENRSAFYDRVGALRDVGQNHLLEMLALITMERPETNLAADVREARARMLRSLRPMTPAEVASSTVRGQYEGYLDLPGVAEGSQTETYYALRTELTGPRWAGVPVVMQSGKRLGPACKRIVVSFKHPHACLCDPAVQSMNRVIFQLEPVESISIVFWTKQPGFDERVEERTFDFFLYEKEEKAPYVEEYAKLLYDAIRGEQRLFVSAEEVAACWAFIDPVLDGWREGRVPLQVYAPDDAAFAERAAASIASPAAAGEVGVVGLGKMGAGLARNLMDNGWRVVGYNRTTSVAEAMESEGLVVARDLRELVDRLSPPRAVWLMLPAGGPVDAALFGEDGLASLLEEGDVIIDGGNSYYRDAAPRAQRLAERGIGYLDCGTSGGPAGARNGACLMIGGDFAVFARLESMFADVSVPGGYGHFGASGAGHFVKMVHNGIEYGMMQSIAEGFDLMHDRIYDLDLTQVANVYQHGSVVESRLVGWLLEAYRELGDDLEGVSSTVGATGEAAWTLETAERIGLELPAIDAALTFRMQSAENPSYAGKVLTALRNAFGGHGLGPGGGPRR